MGYFFYNLFANKYAKAIFASLLKQARFSKMVGKKAFLKIKRAVSSVGSEHLVYTQRVGGSNPSPPTKKAALRGFFILYERTYLTMSK